MGRGGVERGTLLALFAAAHAAPALAYDPLAPKAPAPLAGLLTSESLVENAPGTATIRFDNKGGTDVHVNEIVLIGPRGFTLNSSGKGTTLAPEASLHLEVAWDPAVGGGTDATLLVRAREGVNVFALGAHPPPKPIDHAAIEKGDLSSLIGAKGTQIGSGGLGAGGSSPGSPPTSEPPPRPPPGVHAGKDMIILGALDKSVMDEVIAARMPEIEACYATETKAHKGLAGRLTVKFVVANTGAVKSSSVKSTTFPAGNTERCVLSVVDGMKFPEPRGGGIVIASWPFTFAPE